MNLETKFLKPSFWTFIKYLIFGLIPFWSLGALIYLFITPDPFDVRMNAWWSSLLLIPVGSAIGYTIGARRMQITVSKLSQLEKVKLWTADFLLQNGFVVKFENDRETTFRSNKYYNQLFRDWLGTELTSITMNKNVLIISGPLRQLDKIDTELRFGKLLSP